MQPTFNQVVDVVKAAFKDVRTFEIATPARTNSIMSTNATSSISIVGDDNVEIGQIVIQETSRHQFGIIDAFGVGYSSKEEPLPADVAFKLLASIKNEDRVRGGRNKKIITSYSNMLDAFVDMNGVLISIDNYNEIALTRTALSFDLGNVNVYISFELSTDQFVGLKEPIGDYILSRGMVRLLGAEVSGMIEPIGTWVTFNNAESNDRLHVAVIRYTLSKGEQKQYDIKNKFGWHEAATLLGDQGQPFDIFPAITSLIRSSTESEYVMMPVAAAVEYRGASSVHRLEVLTPTEKWSFTVTRTTSINDGKFNPEQLKHVE